jgi:16S rRNA (guanine527-N7)-methyltransferase
MAFYDNSASNAGLDLIVDGAAELGILLSQEQKRQFASYLAELIKWNKKVNLSGISDSRQIIIKHFLDSLTYSYGIHQEPDINIIDIGTGAGFPGLPLKLAWPQIRLTLLDARLKRVLFLKHLCRRLNLEGVRCLQGRAEEEHSVPEHCMKYKVVVVRAVSSLSQLIPISFPYLVPGGRLIVSYGAQLNTQLEQAKSIIYDQKGVLEAVHQIRLPFSEIIRNIVVIKNGFCLVN